MDGIVIFSGLSFLAGAKKSTKYIQALYPGLVQSSSTHSSTKMSGTNGRSRGILALYFTLFTSGAYLQYTTYLEPALGFDPERFVD